MNVYFRTLYFEKNNDPSKLFVVYAARQVLK
jgi:hypothetical protein